MFVFFSLAFILFAISRTVLRFKDASLSTGGLIFWTAIWIAGAILVLRPGLTGDLATNLGIGRGTDVVVYSSLLLLFYLIFRLYIKISTVDQEITRLVRALAFKKEED